jgi:hypothetical protein
MQNRRKRTLGLQKRVPGIRSPAPLSGAQVDTEAQQAWPMQPGSSGASWDKALCVQSSPAPSPTAQTAICLVGPLSWGNPGCRPIFPWNPDLLGHSCEAVVLLGFAQFRVAKMQEKIGDRQLWTKASPAWTFPSLVPSPSLWQMLSIPGILGYWVQIAPAWSPSYLE